MSESQSAQARAVVEAATTPEKRTATSALVTKLTAAARGEPPIPPLTRADLDSVVRAIGREVKALATGTGDALRTIEHTIEHRVGRQIEQLQARIAVLEARPAPSTVGLQRRIDELEHELWSLRRDALRMAGAWKDGESYSWGQIVTIGYERWLCMDATNSRPGTDHTWRRVDL